MMNCIKWLSRMLVRNQGSYRQINANQNGKVFQYNEAIAGVLQGDYEPIKQLISPKEIADLYVKWSISIEKIMEILVLI